MKRTFSERGQSLVIFVFSVIGLIGITGLAIDGGLAFSDRRQAQNAADTSSLAGALAYISSCKVSGCDTQTEIDTAEAAMEVAALNRAEDNGYVSDLMYTNIEVNRPPVSGPNKDDTEYLQVIIHSTVFTTFAKVLGIPEIHNRVEAVALLQEESLDAIFGGNALVELKPTSSDCSGDFTFGGSATVTLDGGGVHVNSDNDTCAFQCDGSGTSGTLDVIGPDAGISIVGDPGYALDNCTGGINASITSGVKPYPFPPELVLTEPDECANVPADPLPDPDDPLTVTLYPGDYEQLPPVGTYGGVNLNNFEHYILDPGNYCVSKVLKDAGNDTVIEGNGVFIYIKDGGDFNITGGTVKISAPSSPPDNPYFGFLIYVDPGPIDEATGTYDGNPANCTITGNGEHEFTGAIYAPYCDVTIAGDSGPNGIRAQIIAYELKLTGDNSLYFIYNEDVMPKQYTPPATGLTQ